MIFLDIDLVFLPYRLKESPYYSNAEEFPVLIEQRNTFYGAFVTTESFLAAYNERHKNNTVQASPEVLFVVSITILFKKHSCLTAVVNEQLQKYTSSGLFSRWVKLFVDRSHLYRKDEDKIHRPLQMLQVEGIFRVCGYLLGISIVVFGLELVAHRVQWLHDFFDLMVVRGG